MPSEHPELSWSRAGRLIDVKKRNGDPRPVGPGSAVAVNVHPALMSAAIARPPRSAEMR